MAAKASSSLGKGQGQGLGKDQGPGKGKGTGKRPGKDLPVNKKNRPGGSGTTSANRRAMRAGLQWSNLEGEDPGSVECLERHEAALAAALKDACQETS